MLITLIIVYKERSHFLSSQDFCILSSRCLFFRTIFVQSFLKLKKPNFHKKIWQPWRQIQTTTLDGKKVHLFLLKKWALYHNDTTGCCITMIQQCCIINCKNLNFWLVLFLSFLEMGADLAGLFLTNFEFLTSTKNRSL